MNSRLPSALVAAAVMLLSLTVSAAEPLSAKTLLSRIQSKSEAQRVAAIPKIPWRQGFDAEFLAAIDELLDNAVTRTPPLESTVLAIRKLGEFDDSASDELLTRCLKASDWRVVLLAVNALKAHQSPTVPAALRTAWDHPDRPLHYALSHAIVTQLADIRTPQATQQLLELLPQLDGQLKYEAIARLTRTTGKPFGSDVGAWSKWWAEAGGKLPQAMSDPDDSLPRDLKWSPAVPKFFGMPVHAKRVLFVVDRSKSLLSTRDGKTRLETLQEEFTNTLKRLPDDVSFDVIIFGDRVERWKSTLVPADSANKAAAIQAIYSLSATGRTATFDALETGITLDENIEQVLFLTDGQPTAGKIIDTRAIVEAIAGMNQFRHTRIDSFGIAPPSKGEEFLKRLSAQNYGEYTKIP